MIRNERVQTMAIGFGVFLLMMIIGGTFLYGLHRITVDPVQEQYEEQFKKARELRAEYFRQLEESGK